MISKIFKPIKIIVRSLLIGCGFIFLFAIACDIGLGYYEGIYSSDKAYSKIQVGMRAVEVVQILEDIKGYHVYELKALDEKTNQECEQTKLEYDKCKGTGSGLFECEERFPTFKSLKGVCSGIQQDPDKFTKAVGTSSKEKAQFIVWDAEIHVAYMGPAFLHNTFKVSFDRDGRVVSKSEIRRWD